MQRAFFQQQEKSGKLKLRAPTPPKPKQTLKEKYGVPAHLDPILNDPEEAMSLTFSRQLWANAVPGLLLSLTCLVLLGGYALLNHFLAACFRGEPCGYLPSTTRVNMNLGNCMLDV